jgi:hypothetical protein
MHVRPAFRGFPVAGMAVAGAVIGHWLGYLLAIPDPHLRTEILGQGGHGYWVLAVEAALLCGFAAFGSVLLRHVGERLRGVHRPVDGPAALALRLALVQVSSFVAVEIAERAIVGQAFTGIFQHHILWLGIAAQVAVACLGALVLVWFGRVSAKVAEWLARPQFDRPPLRRCFAAQATAPPPQVLRGGPGLRGPPSR